MWQKVLDQESATFYWWNTVTNETTWDNPTSETDTTEKDDLREEGLGRDKDKEEGLRNANQLDDLEKQDMLNEHTSPNDDYYNSQEYYEWYMQQEALQQDSQQQPIVPLVDVNLGGTKVDFSKAMRQMSYFFDVEKYQRERAMEILSGKSAPKKYTPKQIKQFKKKNKEKKIKSLLDRMGRD
jgi:hypothetical protein